AVKMTALVGIKNMLRTAYEAGLKSLEPTDENLKRFGLSITLGGGEVRLLDLTSGYATLANRGKYLEPAAILKVEDKNGKVLEEVKDRRAKQVIDEDITFLISHILSDNNARSLVFGPSSLLNIGGKTVAVKTGTTDDKRDNWAVGYTPSVVVGTWVGNNDNSEMDQKVSSGVTGATPIWNRVMSEILKNKSAENLVEKTLDGKEYFVFVEFDPVSTDGKNRWQEGIDAWSQSQSDPKYKPPSELKNEPTKNPDEITVNIKKPSDHDQVDYTFETEVEVSTGRKVTKIEFYIDGSIRDTKTSDASYKFNFTFAEANKGKHKIKAKAYNEAGRDAEREITVSVGQPWTD
ncbi:MAG: Penicillin-binding protein, 1A family, partial [Candidatus Curtissbacteria bacterium GW2011_GWA2_41_24]